MKTEIILKIENLSKQYRLGLVSSDTIKDDLKRWWYMIRGKEDPFLSVGETNDRTTIGLSEYIWALKDINFEVKKGEVLGIIGANGAGKSTLLKILSKVTSPTTGSVKFNGGIASLLEVGTGFHGELTGRENIFLNGAILGMTKAEINSKLDAIIEFSGCERYIDTPVKRYSSGMNVRLAFAVAAFLEPDILIVDEVLAVGDSEFQKKAIGKMQDISKGDGRTVLFVSHNMNAVKNLCTRAILLENGSITMNGKVGDVVDKYLNNVKSEEVLKNDKVYNGDGCEISNTEIYFNGNSLTNAENIEVKTIFSTTEDREYSINVSVFRESSLSFVSTSFYKEKPIIGPGKFNVGLTIPKYLLNPGLHSITISIVDGTGNSTKYYINIKDILIFEVLDDNYRRGGKYVQGWAGAVSPILDISWKKN